VRIDDVRDLTAGLPRSYEVFVRGRITPTASHFSIRVRVRARSKPAARPRPPGWGVRRVVPSTTAARP
jgi:hypothetical protein